VVFFIKSTETDRESKLETVTALTESTETLLIDLVLCITRWAIY